MRKAILIVCGTRPEVIKLAPLILRLRDSEFLYPLVCNTGQQRDLSRQAFGYFGIDPDIDLDIMKANQSLFDVQAGLMSRLASLFQLNEIAGVVVQGDTISAFCGALAGFYARKPTFHVEAGLRSYSLSEPFPEEGLRQMLSRIASHHFAPTEANRQALLKEGIAGPNISVTGNTVVDALSQLPRNVIDAAEGALVELGLSSGENVVLVTIHRRENHGDRLVQIAAAIRDLSEKFKSFTFVLPMHPNPNVKEYISGAFRGLGNIKLTRPLDYPELVSLMRRASLIISDSGGIQEEAPSFGVPVLVARYETERMEGVEAGVATLVGADQERIVAEGVKILSQAGSFGSRTIRPNPYGDGRASERIVEFLESSPLLGR